MKSIKIEAKNVEKAVKKALNELEIERENAEINVIDEGSKGLLGFIGAKDYNCKTIITNNIVNKI